MSGVKYRAEMPRVPSGKPHPHCFSFGFYRYLAFDSRQRDHVSYQIGEMNSANTVPTQCLFLVAVRPQEVCQLGNPDKPQERFPTNAPSEEGLELEGRAGLSHRLHAS